MNRTHNNNELKIDYVNAIVELKGWVSKTRNLGGLIFIDLRDRYGITQIVVSPENPNYEKAKALKNEFVVYVKGIVVERENKNLTIPTGEIEILASEIEIINEAKQPPIIVADETDALEDTRLKFRYLDLRRPVMQNFLMTRHVAMQSTREYLNSHEFLELETPILTKSTPEGARDYLVPSRVNKGSFYALPQSPQIFKQLFMISGFERYYQIAKCFRDEDLRADRQPEFTQIDIETSFLTQEEIMAMTEGLLVKVWKDSINVEINAPFDVLTYHEAVNKYGSDKPDRRFGMLLEDLSEVFVNSEFSVFKNTVTNNGLVKAIVVKDSADKYSRKDITKLEDFAKIYKAKGLAWLKYQDELTGPIAKFLSDDEKANVINKVSLENNDLILFVADKENIVHNSLGALRVHIANQLDLINKKQFDFCWVVDWPLYEYDEEEGRFYAAHHPFTAPKNDQVDNMYNNPRECIADAYDVVCNGYELGGGSLRIYNQELQAKMFEVLGFTPEDAENQFGFFIESLKYGTPPHGGIALGLDRMIMLLTNTTNIRDVIAFPKTTSAQCTMTEAPSKVSTDQLKELGVKLDG
ncbi:aspartate--tRNA ligase [Mycoplasmatota bacterium]|nr:aspartate--tRNA ligase [Mycoplasmatota bacterium]